jgi:hypothetical protein
MVVVAVDHAPRSHGLLSGFAYGRRLPPPSGTSGSLLGDDSTSCYRFHPCRSGWCKDLRVASEATVRHHERDMIGMRNFNCGSLLHRGSCC